MPNAIIFSRVSTKEQADEGYSLQSQVKLLQEYAEKKQMDVVQRYIIPESARGKQERKLFNAMLADLRKSKATILLCEKVDRITRNFKDAVLLNDWLEENEERQIHFVKQSLVIHKQSKSNEKFQWDIHLVLARQYSNNLSEEASKGLLQKAEEGWCPASQKKGYVTVGVAGKKVWRVDESEASEAPFIRRAFQLYETGEHTLLSLCKQLYDEGWKTAASRRQGKTTLHGILTDCFYCGEFKWKGKHYANAKHEALVSKELFYDVQEKLSRKVTGKYRKNDFLFKGMCQCGECGRSVVGQKQKGHSYYACTRFRTNCSQHKYLREELLDKKVLKLLKSLQCTDSRMLEWVRKALKENHSHEIESREKQVALLRQQLDRQQKRIDTLYDDKVDGKISEEFYKRKYPEFDSELQRIKRDIHKLDEANKKYLNLGSAIFELAQASAKVYESCETDAEKRELLNTVFSNLKVKDGNVLPDYKNGLQLVAARAKNNDWLGRRDSNPRMPAPEAGALPLGDSPTVSAHGSEKYEWLHKKGSGFTRSETKASLLKFTASVQQQ